MRKVALVVAGVLVAGLALTSSVAGQSSGSSYIYVKSRYLSLGVRLFVAYRVPPPLGCPDIAMTDAQEQRFLSKQCQAFSYQQADFIIRVSYGGRVIWTDDGSGLGSGDFIEVLREGTGQGFVPAGIRYRQGRCWPGTYAWTVTFIDPYGRTRYNTSDRGRWTAKC